MILARQKCFLDSSLILSREFGKSELKKKIEQNISQAKKFSSTYAKTEIKRTFLKDAIYLHSLLVEEQNLTAVFQRLQSFPLSQRRIKRCLALLSKITNRRRLRLADAITRLETLILGLDMLLLKDVTMLKSGTECPLADESVRFVPPTYRINTSCTKTSPICAIKKYFNEKDAALHKIHKDIMSDSNLRKLFVLLDKILKKEDTPKGRNCMTLGDTIICLDCPIGYTIYGTNIKDFVPLCRCLSKKFVGVK